MMLRKHVVLAVFKRNLLSYFSGVLGYLFIVVFVVAGAAAAFSPQFFTNNLATLDQLSEYYPLLLLFIVPAITMNAWADEKKLGTDELLFTLPAMDLEILLGKYFSAVAVYTVALGFSLTQLGVLAYYADPDWGLLFSTYFGYWLAGAALLSAGMFASALTSSVTVSFVLGVVICAVPVFVGRLAPSSELLQGLSLSEQLQEFTMGVIPLSGLLYFVSFAVFMLYLNVVVIGKRHWSSGKEGSVMELQFVARAISLAVILASVNVVVGRGSEVVGLRFDMTAENLFTLSATTRDLVKNLDKEHPVTIQAFISPDVPREFVFQQKRLKGLLRQYDRLGGSRIDVRFVDVEPFSEQAEEAKSFGIEPTRVQTEREGRFSQVEVFLGAVVSSPYDEVVIPLFEEGTPVEYELTRSIRTVSQEKRLTVGILRTDAQVNGGFQMATFRSVPEWRIKQELEKQYNVEDVSPDSEIETGKYDVVMAVLPSSLTQEQMTNFVDYVKKGQPVLIFDDPLTWYEGGQNAPRQPKPRSGGMMGQGPPPEQKADGGHATTLTNALEIAWDNGEIVWDLTGKKIHPQFADVWPPEFVFVTPQSGVRSAFNRESSVTSGLQEVLGIFPGCIRPREGGRLKFEALLRSGTDSGTLSWDEAVRPGFFGMGITIEPNPRRFLDEHAHVLAARISSKEKKDGEGINVIYVADVDLISDMLFTVERREAANLKLDNVKFVLNAVDVLAGDESYVELRKRRAKYRPLTEIQRQTDEFRRQTASEQEKAEKDATQQLEKRRESLKKIAKEIEEDAKLSPIEKQQKLQIAKETEQRRLDVAEANIQREKQAKIEELKAREQRQIRRLEDEIRLGAVLLPPIPALLLGLIMLGLRLNAEVRMIEESRRVQK